MKEAFLGNPLSSKTVDTTQSTSRTLGELLSTMPLKQSELARLGKNHVSRTWQTLSNEVEHVNKGVKMCRIVRN